MLLADDGGMKRRYEQAAQASFRLGVAPLPARKEKTANLEPTIFQIFKSRDPERTAAAWEFAKFWLTRENQVRLMTEAGYPQSASMPTMTRWPGIRPTMADPRRAS